MTTFSLRTNSEPGSMIIEKQTRYRPAYCTEQLVIFINFDTRIAASKMEKFMLNRKQKQDH